jgi:hypothetical protein
MIDRPTSSTEPRPIGPGEARTRQRRRRQAVYLGVAMIVGAVTGLATGLFDKGGGDLFAGGAEQLALDPPAALGIAALLLFGLMLLPLYGFRTIDELKREQNLVAFTGGCIAVFSGFPVWAVLHAGGWGAAPHPFGVWAMGFVGMSVSWLYAWWRT